MCCQLNTGLCVKLGWTIKGKGLTRLLQKTAKLDKFLAGLKKKKYGHVEFAKKQMRSVRPCSKNKVACLLSVRSD